MPQPAWPSGNKPFRRPRPPPQPRIADSLIALCLLVALAPLLLCIALLIAACGQSPFFRQPRIGWRQRAFVILKFRTQAPLPIQRQPRRRDRLFLRLAGALRQSHLDELPQLVNILRGEMRFIGPRPLTRRDVGAMPPWRRRRFAVHPGLTGLAQVCGGQMLGPAEKLHLDLYYLQNRSPALDIWILARTLGLPTHAPLLPWQAGPR